MEVMEAIRTRRSIRAYKPDAVPEDALTTVLEAARVICCLTLGYPAAEGVFRGRKSAAEVISFDRY